MGAKNSGTFIYYNSFSTCRREPTKVTLTNDRPKEKEANGMARSKIEDGKVLVADDDESMRELVVDVLESTGYSVIATANGMEAIRVFKERKNEICLVILDRKMPEMNGDDAFRAMKTAGLNVPLLISSGSSKGEKELIDEGVAGFIMKPYRIDELIEKIKSALENQKKG